MAPTGNSSLPSPRRPRPARPLRGLAGLGVALLGLLAGGGGALAQQSGYGQTLGGPQGPQPFDSSPGGGSGKSDSVLGASNPMDLINRLRRSTAMDNATPPSSAIDQALKDFDAQTAPPRPSSGSGRTLQGP